MYSETVYLVGYMCVRSSLWKCHFKNFLADLLSHGLVGVTFWKAHHKRAKKALLTLQPIGSGCACGAGPRESPGPWFPSPTLHDQPLRREHILRALPLRPLPAASPSWPRNHLQFLTSMWLPGVPQAPVSATQQGKGMAWSGGMSSCCWSECQCPATCTCMRGKAGSHPPLGGGHRLGASALTRGGKCSPTTPHFYFSPRTAFALCSFFNTSLILIGFARLPSVGAEPFKCVLKLIFIF